MKITYKRELKHNYLIIEPEEALYDNYEIRMMASNGIDGLLKFHVKQVDSRKSYYYEITSRQPLSRLLECRSIGAEEVRHLISGISQTIKRLDAYLLQEERILMEPEFIYVEPEQYEPGLCLVPGKQGNFPEDMTSFLQYLLGKVDHQDKECVVLAYGLYQESLKENYGIDDLLRLLAAEPEEKGSDFSRNNLSKGEKRIENTFKEETCTGIRQQDYFTDREADSAACRQDWQEYRDDRAEVVSDEAGTAMAYGVLLKTVPLIGVILGSPLLVWLLLGIDGITSYWYVLLGIDVLAIFSAIYRLIQERGKVKKQENPRQKNYAFRNLTEDDEEYQDKNPIQKNSVNRGEKGKDTQREIRRKIKPEKAERYNWQMSFEEEAEESRQENAGSGTTDEFEVGTVLLTVSAKPEGARYLRAMSEGIEDIVISYVPFIIGKQEGLVDFALNQDTVSRIHARIDREGDEYRITDLNSTNGTIVGEKVLDTNETAVLLPGDEVYIANLGFIFT